MTTQNNNLTLKILIGVLGALLLILGIFTYKFYNEEKNLLKEKQRVVVLLDSLKDYDANVALIARYRREVSKLKKERERLFKLADSLTTANVQLTTDLDSTSTALTERIIFSDSLATQNSKLAEIVERGSALQASGVKAEGVRVRNSGKITTTSRSSRAEKVRVCFTLSPNKLTEKGDKELFAQVINPANNLIGDKVSVNFEDAVLTYSGRNKVFYENDALDVCIMVDVEEGELVKGNYVVNLFSGPRMIANTQFELK